MTKAHDNLDDTVDEHGQTRRLPSLEELQASAPVHLAVGTGPAHESVDPRRRVDTGRYRRVIEESADGVVAELNQRLDLTIRERQIAGALASAVVTRLPGIIADRPDNQRLAKLEIRADATDAWRLKLTGVADGNGRIGELDRTVADLRDDVGTSEERKIERAATMLVSTILKGVKRRMNVGLLVSVVAVGASAWGWLGARSDARAAAAATAARTDTRLEYLERLIFDRRDARPAATPDPARLP